MQFTGLPSALQRTFHALRTDSPSPNATWDEVRALLEAVADLTVENNGNLTAIRGGHVLTLHPAFTKDLAESGEAKALRRFLQDSDTAPAEAAGRDPHLLLAIHGANARLYRCQVIGGIPQLVLPYEAAEPNPEDRTARNPSRAPKPPPDACFYRAMAEELQAAGQIVVLETGDDGAAAEFVAWLSQHDSELSRRITGVVHAGGQPLDCAGLLAAARRHYATLRPTPDSTAR